MQQTYSPQQRRLTLSLPASLCTAALVVLYFCTLSGTWAAKQTSTVDSDQQTDIAGSTETSVTTAPAKTIEGGTDWPNFSGPFQNHSSNEVGLVDKWDPKSGKNLLWKNDKLAARCTPVVMNGRLYINARADEGTSTEGERVVCADAATGDIIWERKNNVYLSDVPAERVGWSSVTCDPETGYVYSMGVCGLFQCLDGKTGDVIWQQSMHERYGLLSTYGGRTNTPVIFEDMVIISAVVIGWGEMAKPAHRFIAFNKKTGEVRWFRGTRDLPYDTTYGTPTVAVLGGQAALVFGSGDGAVWALQPRTGKQIWKFRFSGRGINTSPLVAGDVVYASHSEENRGDSRMGAIVALDGASKREITKRRGTKWIQYEKMIGKSSPLLIPDKKGDRVIAVDDRAKIWMFDARNGRALTSKSLGTAMRGTPLYADGKIYLVTMEGTYYCLKVGPRRFTVLHQQRLRGEETHGSPIVSNGRIYLSTMRRMYCLGDKSVKPKRTAPPKMAKEKPVTNNKPATLQLIPAEALLKPGEKQQYKVRAFNSLGQEVKLPEGTEVKYSTPKPGLFTADAANKHTATTIKVSAAGLIASARVRVVPPLPWKFDFTTGIPITWVGARYRHIVKEIDGNKVMTKVSTIPKGTRSQAWFGQPSLKNYTIQADAQATAKDGVVPGGMPDIGVTAQGYILALRGSHQELQIRSWATQLRMAKTIKFAWKPGTWYSMKLKASLEKKDGKDVAVLRGKVWPKGQKEPEKWTIEATDNSPQKQGSPGLFGDATRTEFYLDNISVTPNE